jgi:integrase
MTRLPEDLLPFYDGDNESVADQSTSTPGKITPPGLIGILADGQYMVSEYTSKEEFGSNYTKGEDILDYLIRTMTNASVIKRVGDEFCAEAKIKMGKFKKLTIEWKGERSNEHPTSMFFHDSNITYGSWSLSALVRDALADAGYKSPPTTVSCDALLKKVVIPGYTKRHIKRLNNPVEMKEVLKKMATMHQLLQQAMWDWDEDKKVFEVGRCPEKSKAYKNKDSNTVRLAKGDQEFGFHFNELVIKLAKLEKKTVIQVTREFTRGVVVQVPELKELKRKEVVARGTMLILHPTIIEEVTFRRMVKGMQDEVFNGVKDWGNVKIKKEIKVGKRLASAICLLQLGIGSRVLGIIAVNKIEALDPIETKATEDTKLDDRDAKSVLQDISTGLRVGRITKNKNEDLQTANLYASRARFDEEFTEEKARKIIKGEREAFVVDKPMQYYFFDQNTVKKEATGPVSEPRAVFLQLLKVVRECVKHISEKGLLRQEANWVVKNPEQKNKMPRVEWESYMSAGRKIFMVKETDTASVAMTQLFNSVYNVVKKKCVGWLKTIPNVQDTTTHMLRRMYVCYSYQFFGRGRVKEIGYAQYVLKHKSVESSIFYTTMQFNMALDGRLGVDEERYNEAIEQIEKAKSELVEMKDDVKQQLRRLREKSDEVELVLDMGARKRVKREVELKRVDGTTVMYTKKPREVRKSSREVKVANGVTEAKKLQDDGFLMTRVNLTKAGINVDIVRDVLDKVLSAV